jgi:aldehyde dehydrogenase (NAD+)
VAETTQLLNLQWDHIFYTGSTRVARIVSIAAAKHLTPVTLELGGKCPVIIDPAARPDDIKLAAKRTLWGKVNNAGQICLAPDYVLVHRDQQDEFIKALKEYHDIFFPEGALQSSSYGRIVTLNHRSRLVSLLERSQGTISFGGKVDGEKGFEPTVVRDVKGDDSLMEEEIFGPILPVVPVDSINEAIAFVKSRPHPLALYVFTDDPALKQRFVDTTLSGSLVFNDTFMQAAVNELPFSGIGESGHGSQVLRYTFDAFTHLRSSIDVPKEIEQFLEARYAPYTEEKFKIMTAPVGLPIPK